MPLISIGSIHYASMRCTTRAHKSVIKIQSFFARRLSKHDTLGRRDVEITTFTEGFGFGSAAVVCGFCIVCYSRPGASCCFFRSLLVFFWRRWSLLVIREWLAPTQPSVYNRAGRRTRIRRPHRNSSLVEFTFVSSEKSHLIIIRSPLYCSFYFLR